MADRMELYEIRALLSRRAHADRDGWEQARLIAYVIAQSNSKNKLKLQDIAKFPWETENEKVPQKTPEEMKQIWANARRTAEALQNMIIN